MHAVTENNKPALDQIAAYTIRAVLDRLAGEISLMHADRFSSRCGFAQADLLSGNLLHRNNSTPIRTAGLARLSHIQITGKRIHRNSQVRQESAYITAYGLPFPHTMAAIDTSSVPTRNKVGPFLPIVLHRTELRELPAPGKALNEGFSGHDPPIWSPSTQFPAW